MHKVACALDGGPRLRFLAIVLAEVCMLTGCASSGNTNIEVTPAVLWVVTGDSGRHTSTNRYASYVAPQGVPFTLDFSQHDYFTSPDTRREENYFDGVLANFTVAISNTTAFFSGRIEYELHLGTTSSYNEDDESLYAQTLRSYSTRFSGTSTLGHAVRIGAGADINDEPSVCLIFRRTTAPVSKFAGVVLDDKAHAQ